MATKDEVRQFLKDFKDKMQFWDVVFLDDRGKNAQTLADLELRPAERKKILEGICVEDYSQGPLEEQWHGASFMWVFGVEVKNSEIYVKVSIGVEGASVICISFHVAEYPMEYPFKNQ